jgi:hypothetical protein
VTTVQPSMQTDSPPPGPDRTRVAAAASILLGLLAVLGSPYVGFVALLLFDSIGLGPVLDGTAALHLAALLCGALVGLGIQAALLIAFRRVRFRVLCLASFAAAVSVYLLAALWSALDGRSVQALWMAVDMLLWFGPTAFAGYVPAFLAFAPVWRKRQTGGALH